MAICRMRTWVILWVVVISQVVACTHLKMDGENPPPDGAAAPALAMAYRHIDFGSIVPGARVSRSLSLENRGGMPLIIGTVRPSDPFQLKAQVSKASIPASGTAQLQIELVPDLFMRGPFQGEILIYANDPDQRLAKVVVTAAIDTPIDWQPPFIEHVVRQGQRTNLPDLVVDALDGKAIGPLLVESSVPEVTAKVAALNDTSHVISLDMDTNLPLGTIEGEITVMTNHAEMPAIGIPMRIYIFGNLTVDAPVLELGILAPNVPASAKISLSQQTDRPTRIISVEPHLPVACDVDIDETPTGYQLTVNLTDTPPLQPLGGHLRIFTDHPTQPQLDVPVEGWVAAADPFALDGGGDSDDNIHQMLLYALYMEELLTPPKVIDDILGGHRDQRSLDQVLRAFASDNWHTRQRAMQVIGKLGQRQAVETIRKAVIEDPDEDVRAAAIAALVEVVGDDALPELELALQDNDEIVRMDAAKLLGEIGDPRAVPWLLRARADEEESVREVAKHALNQIAAASD